MNLKNEPKKNNITVPSEATHVRTVSSKVLASLASYKLDEDALFSLKLCIEEAVRNAMVHGNKSAAAREVRVLYWIEDGTVNIEVEDEGKGYDYKTVSDPTLKENITKGAGRGVFLIKKLMDKVEFNESGNKIKMMKRIK